MSLEADLVVALQAVCPRVHPIVAPLATARPYLTWQLVGGPSWRYVDNAAPGQRQVLVQVNTWGATMAQVLATARSVESALCASAAFTAAPQGEPLTEHAADFNLYGALQDFLIEGPRDA
jgi:hypothetical protein